VWGVGAILCGPFMVVCFFGGLSCLPRQKKLMALPSPETKVRSALTTGHGVANRTDHRKIQISDFWAGPLIYDFWGIMIIRLLI